MNKNRPISHTDDWMEKLQTHPFFHWSVENWRWYLYGFLLFAITSALGLSLSTRSSTKAESNYLLADNYLQILQKNIPDETLNPSLESTLAKLEKITQEYPELQPKYEGIIAQFLLLQKEEQKASLFSKKILKRVQTDELPIYSRFTEITLLTSQGNYQEALSQSQALHKELLDSFQSPPHSKSDSSTALLFAYNLLRIAMLNKQTEHKEGEIKAWQEWERYAAIDKENKDPLFIDPKSFGKIKDFFKEGNFSLDQYIGRRKEILGMSKSAI